MNKKKVFSPIETIEDRFVKKAHEALKEGKPLLVNEYLKEAKIYACEHYNSSFDKEFQRQLKGIRHHKKNIKARE